MTAAIANASTTIADSLAGAGIAIADDELEILLEQGIVKLLTLCGG